MRLVQSLAILATCALWARASAAQTFTQVIVFGDSTVDSGYYKALSSPTSSATVTALWPAAVAAGAGAPTTGPGFSNSQFLASYFGLTANPANQPGGTNYATSGAKNVTINTAATGGFTAAIPTTTQIASYLTANKGHVDANALYLVSSGGNDITYALGQTGTGPFPANPTAYVTSAANSLATAIENLQTAGAHYIVVPNQPYAYPGNNPTEQQLRLTYSQTLWNALTAAGVSYIAADYNAMLVSFQTFPSTYGFLSISNTAGQTACSVPTGLTTSWGLLCSSNASAPSQLVTPSAAQTYLFADDQHFTTAGQKFEADYYYGLIVKTWGAAATIAPIDGTSSVEIAPTFNGSDGNLSFIRLGNTGPATTTFNITVLGSPSGTVYGTTQIQVPANASPQYPLSQILTSAGAGSLANGDTSYSLYMQDADLGTSYQHVIYNGSNAFFENVSVCKYRSISDYTGLNYKLANVHTTQLAAYPAQIYIHNFAPNAVTYKALIYDAVTGALIGTAPVAVGANATFTQPFAWFEQQINWTPTSSQLHANMVLESTSPATYEAEVGQYIFNQQLAAYVNMTQRCGL